MQGHTIVLHHGVHLARLQASIYIFHRKGLTAMSHHDTIVAGRGRLLFVGIYMDISFKVVPVRIAGSLCRSEVASFSTRVQIELAITGNR